MTTKTLAERRRAARAAARPAPETEPPHDEAAELRARCRDPEAPRDDRVRAYVRLRTHFGLSMDEAEELHCAIEGVTREDIAERRKSAKQKRIEAGRPDGNRPPDEPRRRQPKPERNP